MATQNKTQENDTPVAGFIAALGDEHVIGDCMQLIEIMAAASGHEPKMWGSSIVGFDAYHYTYASGREGDTPVLGFSPRKGKIAIYIDAASEARSLELFAKLGKHTTSKACIYIKDLSDVDTSILLQILEQSYDYIKSKAQDGQ